MTTQGVKRKLTAILSADVVGYSRLMGEDDAATVRTLGEYREVIANYIIEYRGRVVDSPGDNLLAEFASVVDAVQCATEIQRELAERNTDIPDARKMEYRIGVNLGDVIEEGERIYGDGVNVAARLESMAEPGGIYISGIAHDQVKSKLNLEYQFVGKKSVKNIKEPIRVYRVLSFPGAAAHRVTKAKLALGKTWRNTIIAIAAVLVVGAAVAVWHFYLRPSPSKVEVASEQTPAPESPDEMPPPVPDKPSIAVLPFANISGDPKEDYLSDGITEQIITALSKVPQMLVIARNSVFTYKGKPVKVQQVSEDLGVRYVLEGSVQKSGDRLRVTAQLIDANTGNHLWSERYDRDLKDLFELQDDITKNTVTALRVKLTEGETAGLFGKGTKNLEAYLKVMRGTHHFFRMNSNDNEIARGFFEEAIDLDLDYAQAYVLLAWTYFHDALFGWAKVPAKSYEKAVELARKAISVDEQNAHAYMVLANVYAKTGQSEKAVVIGKKALSLDPAMNYLYGLVLNNVGQFKEAIPFLKKSIRMNPKPQSFEFAQLGLSYHKTGQFKQAIELWKKAIRVDPRPPSWYLFSLGWAYFYTGQNEEAIAAFNKSVSREPPNDYLHASLGCILIAAGKPEEAAEMFEKALNLNPNPPIWYIRNLAVARLGTGKSEEAITTMRELISRRPDDSEAYRGLSVVLTFQRKYEEAVSMAKKSISLKSPVEAVAYFYLGAPYLMVGEYEEAISAFKRSINIWPEYLDPHLGLAAVYSLAGRVEDARAQAEAVLKISPNFSLEDIAKNGYFNFQKPDKESFVDALRKAGLK